MLDVVEKVRRKYKQLSPYLDERTLRIWSAVEAESLGRGGITRISQATSLSRTTIYKGIAELSKKRRPKKAKEEHKRIRKPGGGRTKLKDKEPGLLQDLDSILEPVTRGDPESPLRWTCKSTIKIAEELRAQGYQVSQRTVCDLLYDLGYSLQSNRKIREGSQHPDRNDQFLYISKTVKEFQAKGKPVISVDTKKKELIGEFKNSGQEWRKKGKPIEVNIHDFADC